MRYAGPIILAFGSLVLSACGARPYHVEPLVPPARGASSTLPGDFSGLPPIGIWDFRNAVPAGKYVGGRFDSKYNFSFLRTQFESFYWDPPGDILCELKFALEEGLMSYGAPIPAALHGPTAAQPTGNTCARRVSPSTALRSVDALLVVELDDIAINGWSRGIRAPELEVELRLTWTLLPPDGDESIPLTTIRTFGRGSKNSRDGDEAILGAFSAAARESVNQLAQFPGMITVTDQMRRAPEERLALAEELRLREAEAAARAAAAGEARQAAALRENEERRARSIEEERRRREQSVAQQADAEAAERLRWRRAAPEPLQILTLEAADLKPRETGPAFERVQEAVVTLVGDQSSGTAFLISKDGLALTNEHVVRSNRSLEAVFSSGTRLPARILRVHAGADVALIQIACMEDCFTAVLHKGDASVGTEIYLLGAPRGLGFSLTGGIVSGVRLFDGITYIQTDAAANPGNSGGPLFSKQTGEVYGIVTFGRRDSEGLSFAVSVNDALRVLGIRIP